MARAKILYSCTECGATSPKWMGQCADCGAWNTLTEIAPTPAPARGGRFGGYAGTAGAQPVQHLSEVPPDDVQRQPTGIGEFDRVLGGGLVPGSVVLIGGDPGIGKSTLLLQTLAACGPIASGLVPSPCNCWPRRGWKACWPRQRRNGPR